MLFMYRFFDTAVLNRVKAVVIPLAILLATLVFLQDTRSIRNLFLKVGSYDVI